MDNERYKHFEQFRDYFEHEGDNKPIKIEDYKEEYYFEQFGVCRLLKVADIQKNLKGRPKFLWYVGPAIKVKNPVTAKDLKSFIESKIKDYHHAAFKSDATGNIAVTNEWYAPPTKEEMKAIKAWINRQPDLYIEDTENIIDCRSLYVES